MEELQRPLKLLAIYLRNSPLYGSSGLSVSLQGVSECKEYNILWQTQSPSRLGENLQAIIRCIFSIYYFDYFERVNFHIE